MSFYLQLTELNRIATFSSEPLLTLIVFIYLKPLMRVEILCYVKPMPPLNLARIRHFTQGYNLASLTLRRALISLRTGKSRLR